MRNVAAALASFFLVIAPTCSAPCRSKFGGTLHGFFVLEPSVFDVISIGAFLAVGGGSVPGLGSILQVRLYGVFGRKSILGFGSQVITNYMTAFLRNGGSFTRHRRWLRIKQLWPWVVDLCNSVRFWFGQRLSLIGRTAMMPNLQLFKVRSEEPSYGSAWDYRPVWPWPCSWVASIPV